MPDSKHCAQVPEPVVEGFKTKETKKNIRNI